MRPSVLAVIVLMISVLSGCARQSIVGEWQGSRKVGPATARVRYTFTRDGRYVEVNEIGSAMGSLETKWSGTYELRGDRLVLSQQHGTVNGAAIRRSSPAVETKSFEIKDDTLTLESDEARKVVLQRKMQ